LVMWTFSQFVALDGALVCSPKHCTEAFVCVLLE